MDEISQACGRFFKSIGLFQLQGDQFLMVLVGLMLIMLAVSRRRGSLLLVTLGFGIVVGNLPFAPVEHAWDAHAQGQGVFAVLQFLLSPNLLPALVFLGIGAMTDFSPLIASPRLAILGAGAQVGIFAAVVLGGLLGLTLKGAAVAAAVGGAHSPLAIFAAAALAPERLGAAAIVAYVLMLMAPAVLTPVMKLLTTPEERRIRMAPPRSVSRRLRILFPVAGFILCVLAVPASRGILGMLFLGNLLRESGDTMRLSRTIGRTFTDIITVLLAFGVGLATTGEAFLTPATPGLFVIGLLSFMLAAGWGILMARIMNLFTRRKINPLLGAAGVTIAPFAARAVQRLVAEEDPENHLLRQAMVPNLAAVIALALSVGIFISMLS